MRKLSTEELENIQWGFQNGKDHKNQTNNEGDINF